MQRKQTLKCENSDYAGLSDGQYLKFSSAAASMAGTDFNADVQAANDSNRLLAECYMNGNSTNTTVTVQGTYYKVAGTFSAGDSKGSSLTSDSGGRLTYTGTPTVFVWCSSSIALKPDGGGNRQLGIAFHKNGSIVSKSEMNMESSQTFTNSTQIQAVISLATNDYVEVHVANKENTTDICVGDINILGVVCCSA